ncbi:MAG TPA: four-carbon acid sugar kinase family protein, partial [Acidobacteriaceae bacterium]|nr:four-carbon acid sugar kinase family protein [Acidobacteriaceae bacterium]
MSHHDDESIRHDSSSRRLVIIADDLTGACDSAVAFADVANPVKVHITHNLSIGSGVTLFSTNSRDLPANEARERLAEVAPKVPAGCTVFKKVDSVFRGNTFTEIANSIELFPAEVAVLAPAYPSMGRRLRNGVLEVESHGGRESIPILELLKQHGCAPGLLRASTDVNALASELKAALSNGTKLVLCDATEHVELSAAVEAAESLRRETLWIGSGALAHAIAGRWPKHTATAEPGLPAGEVVFFIGSDHPVTRGQQLHLERTSGIDPAGPTDTRSRVVSVPRNNASE